MRYKDMIESAKSMGVANEKTMWKSIDRVDKLLESIKGFHKDVYWEFMRNSHEDMFGCHYDKEYAEYDVSNLYYTDADGVSHKGAHWTLDEILRATSNYDYDSDITDYDKYVAYNAAYADFCKKFSEEQIIDIAYLFYFADEDSPSGKVWAYMSAMM